MFLVSDTFECRQARIRAMLNKQDAAIAVLVAAADFERTVRRAIVALGTQPTAAIRKRLSDRDCHGLDGYKAVWSEEVRSVDVERSYLPQVVPRWQFSGNKHSPSATVWCMGSKGTTGVRYAQTPVNASGAAVEFARKRDIDIYQRLRIRRKARG